MYGMAWCAAEKDTEVAELQKQIKLYSQKEAASSKNVKALEAQVGTCAVRLRYIELTRFTAAQRGQVTSAHRGRLVTVNGSVPLRCIAQVERNKKAAEAARGALAAREHQLKEFSKEAAKAGKDRSVPW